MLKIAQKHPILCVCAVVSIVSLSVAAWVVAAYGAGSTLAVFAIAPLLAAGCVAAVILNYKVFGGAPNSSIHRPGVNPDNEPR